MCLHSQMTTSVGLLGGDPCFRVKNIWLQSLNDHHQMRDLLSSASVQRQPSLQDCLQLQMHDRQFSAPPSLWDSLQLQMRNLQFSVSPSLQDSRQLRLHPAVLQASC